MHSIRVASAESKLFSRAGDLLGQGLELSVQNSNAGGNHKFNFDKVFGPTSQQVSLLSLHTKCRARFISFNCFLVCNSC